MSDDFRDSKGRLKKGAPALFKGKPKQTDQPPPPSDDSSFDADLISAANSFGRARAKTGRRAYCEWLRDHRAIDFAALLTKALAREAEAKVSAGSGGPGVVVNFTTAPSGMHLEDGRLIEAEGARALWARRTGHQDQPPAKSAPVLAYPRDDEMISFGGDDDDDDAA